MKNRPNHTSNQAHFPWHLIPLLLCLQLPIEATEFLPPDAYNEDQINIIEGENRLIYEYRQNGILTMIKVVPDKGRAYYMVPANGSPRYQSLDHERKLYPQWVIVEW